MHYRIDKIMAHDANFRNWQKAQPTKTRAKRKPEPMEKPTLCLDKLDNHQSMKLYQQPD